MLRPRLLKMAPVFAVGLALTLACAGCSSHETVAKEIAEANARWDSGDKADAVRRYKTLYDNRWAAAADKEFLLVRIVEFETSAGHPDKAREWIGRGLDDNLSPAYTGPLTKELLAAVQREREEQRLAEAKRAQEEAAAAAKRQEEERTVEAKRQEAEVKRRTEIWRSELEEQAHALAKKADALEAHLKEREATYKRRTEAGGADYSTKKEIEQLKEEIPKVWEALAHLEDEIEAGPPDWVVKGEKPPATATAAAPTPSSAGKPPTTGPQPDKPSTSVASAGPKIVWSPSTGPKTVHVSGYTRKDGTYVKPYTRSSPRRK